MDQKLLDDVKASLSSGRSVEEIYKGLLEKGGKIEDIQRVFSLIRTDQEKEDTQRRTIRIIVTIAAISVGAGIFSFIAANWWLMSRPLKVLVIMLGMVVSYGSGWFFKEKYRFVKTGEALILLGAIIYGAGIFLVGQMFNVRANWPDGFILWMTGVLGMAFAVESFNLFYLAILTGIGSLFGHPWTVWNTLSGHDPFLLTSSFLLSLAVMVTFVAGVRVRKKLPPELRDFY